MEVIESTNSNPSPKVKSRDLLISKLCVHYNMSINQSSPRLEKAWKLVKEENVHLYDDNPLRARVEGRETYFTNLSKNTCTCLDKVHNLKPHELCKHLGAHRFTEDLRTGILKVEEIKA